MDGVEVFGDLFCGFGIYFGMLDDDGISIGMGHHERKSSIGNGNFLGTQVSVTIYENRQIFAGFEFCFYYLFIRSFFLSVMESCNRF